MKKITLTLLAFIVTCSLWQINAQNYESLSEAIDSGVRINTTTNTNRQAVITEEFNYAVNSTFVDRATFDAAAGPGMFLEDFEGGPAPGVLTVCGSAVNSAGNACYPPGEILPGVSIYQAGDPTNTLGIGTGWSVNVNPVVGSNTFVDFTRIDFSTDVNAVGFDLYTLFTGTTTDIRIFGAGGLIATFNVATSNPSFFGAIADEAILSVELESTGSAQAEEIGLLAFGRANSQTCGLAPLPIPAVGTSGPMDPSPAAIGLPGTVGTDYSIASVSLDLNHTFDGDLDISLTSPDGTVLALSNDNGGSGDNYTGTVFVDGAPNINGGSAPFTGMFEPEGGTLNGTFAGDNLTGNWILNINDQFGGDSGTLLDWCINFAPILGSPPIIMCPGDINVFTDPGACGAVVNYVVVAIDPDGNLDTVEQIDPDPLVLGTGDEFPVGTTAVTFRATDTFGNFAECTFNVNVADNEDPVVVCQDITVQLDANGDATIVPGDVVASSGDNCPGETLEFQGAPTVITTGQVALNMAGNQLQDTPVTLVGLSATAGDVTVDLEYQGDFGSASSECFDLQGPDGSQVFLQCATPQCSVQNTNFTVLAATWNNWITTFGSDLTFTLIADPQVNGNLCGGGFPDGYYSLTVNAPGAALPSLDFTCADVGPNNVTVIVTDASGNTATCVAVVTVEDNIAPIIVCIGEQVTGPNTESDSPGTAILDNSTVSTTITVPDSFTITDLNIDLDITHTWVGDLQITLESPASTQVLIFDGSADGCSGDNIMDLYDDESANPLSCVPASGDAFPLADYIPSNALSAFDGEDSAGVWTLFVEDTAGGDQGTINSWSIIYDFDPIVSPPLEVDLDANGMATLNASALLLNVDEACGWTATVAGVGAPISLETTFAGGNGNFGNMFDMNALNDVTVDSFDIHGDTGATFDVEVYAKAGTYVGFETDPGAWTLIGTAPGVVSNGDGVATPLDLMLGYDMGAGETHAFYVTPTDFSTGGFNYTNGTGVGNVFASDANIEFLEGSGSGYPFNGTLFSPRVWNGNIIYTAGGGMSTTIDFTCEDLGENIIEVTVTDDSGNVATCTATVNVNDVTPPVLICMDVTIELDENGMATIDPNDLLGVMPSSYEVITISSDNQSGAVGNTDLTVPVTVADNITFDWMYNTSDGPAFDSFGYLLNGVFTEVIDPGGANTQMGTTGPIAVAPGDVFGFRSSSVDGLFGPSTTVVSNFIPGFTGQFEPANWTLTLDNSDGDAFFVEIPGGPLSFDACGIEILAADVTEVTCADIGTPIVVTVFASDSSLNIAVCQSTVTVVDLLPPVMTCPEDQTVDPGVGNLFWVVEDYFALGTASATDNCTDPVTILTQDPAPGTLLIDGVYTVTITGEDEYGNVGTCTFELTVESILGLDDQGLGDGIAMYPNPAQDKVTIANSTSIQLDQLAIYDVNGRLINTVDLSDMQQERTIDVSNLSSGVYMVQIQGEGASTVKRLVKE